MSGTCTTCCIVQFGSNRFHTKTSIMSLSEYGLATLRFVYTSKLRRELLGKKLQKQLLYLCLFVCMLFAFLLCSGLCVAVQLSWTSRSARLQYTIANLRRSLEWSGSDKDWPLPQRLPRRAWRVSYLKRPFRAKISIRTALRSTLLVKAQQDEAYEPECRAF